MSDLIVPTSTKVTPIPDHKRTEINLSKLTYTQRTMNHVADIVKDLHGTALRAAGFYNFNGAILEDQIDIQVEGTSLAKRVGSWLYNNVGKTKLDKDAAQRIGELAADAKGFTCEVDITSTFDWNDGDFGDAGSCFFRGRDYARARCETLPRAYASAIRFWRKDAGIGRCFIVPLPRRTVGAHDAYLLTNYYGVNVTPQRAAMVAQHMLADTFGGAWAISRIEASNGWGFSMYWNPAQQMVLHRPDFTPPTRVVFENGDLDHDLRLPKWAQEGLDEYDDEHNDYDDYDNYDPYDDND